MVLSPIFLALGRGRDERAQRPGPVRRGRPRADRLQPRDHRRGAPAGAVDGRRRAWRSASSPGRSATCSSSSRRSRGVGFRYTPRIDTADPAARQALALMAPRAIGLGREPDHVRRRDGARLDPRGRRGDRVHVRVHAAPDPDRGDRRAARRRALPVAVARGGRGRPRRVRRAARPGAAAPRVRDAPDRGPRRDPARGDRRAAVRRASTPAAILLTADTLPRVPARARRRTR